MPAAVFAPAVAVTIGTAALLAYAAGVHRIRRAGGVWPQWRELLFLGGVAACLGAVVAPLGDRFSRHVIEHIVLGMLGPGLIAASAPLTLLARSLPRAARPQYRRVLRSAPAAVATHPLVAVTAAVLGPWVLWLTPLNDWQRDHAAVHALVHAHLVASGLLFGVAVLGLDTTPWRRRHGLRLFAAALALPLHTLLGLVLLSASTPYLNPTMSPEDGLTDQRFGAALLWLAGDGLATAVILIIVGQWFAAERRRDAISRRTPRAVTAAAPAGEPVPATASNP